MTRLKFLFDEEEKEEELKPSWGQRMRGIGELPEYEIPKSTKLKFTADIGLGIGAKAGVSLAKPEIEPPIGVSQRMRDIGEIPKKYPFEGVTIDMKKAQKRFGELWRSEFMTTENKWKFLRHENWSEELIQANRESMILSEKASKMGVNIKDWINYGVYMAFFAAMAVSILPILSGLPKNILNNLAYKVKGTTVKGKELFESIRRVAYPDPRAGFGKPSIRDKEIFKVFTEKGGLRGLGGSLKKGITITEIEPRFAFKLYAGLPADEIVKSLVKTGRITADIARELSLDKPELVSQVIQNLSVASPAIAAKLGPELTKLIPEVEPKITEIPKLTKTERTILESPVEIEEGKVTFSWAEIAPKAREIAIAKLEERGYVKGVLLTEKGIELANVLKARLEAEERGIPIAEKEIKRPMTDKQLAKISPNEEIILGKIGGEDYYTDTRIIIKGKPEDVPISKNKPDFEQIIVDLPKEETKIEPVIFSHRKDFEPLVWFDNKAAITERYYDLILKKFPEAEFRSVEKIDPRKPAPKAPIKIYEADEFVGVVMPYRQDLEEIPERVLERVEPKPPVKPTKPVEEILKKVEEPIVKEEIPKVEVKEPTVPMATTEQKAEAYIIAKDSKLITTTPSGKISDIRYRRVAKAITGKTTIEKMTEAEADEFIEAIRGVVQRRPWEPPIIPLSTKIVPKEFFEIEFREPTIPKYITPKDYLLREIGAEDLVKDVTEAHRVAYLEGIKINNWIDKIVREINKKAPIGQKLKRAIFAKPTDRLAKFRDLLDTYKTVPDFLSEADQKIFTQLRRFTKKMLDDTNKVRGKLGLDLIKEVEAYIPHFVDELTKQIVNKKYPFPEDVKYWLGRNMPKKIYNPTAMERRVKEDLNKFFSKDLGALLKTLAKYDLRDIYLSEPYSVMRASLNALGDRIPANVRREIDDYMKYDIFSYPENLDTLFNATVKIPIDVINKFLKPFGRVITNPARSISNLTRRFVLLGAIWSRPKLVIRNLGQRLLIMDLYQPKYFLKAQLTKMPRENWAEIKDTTFYKISRRFEDIPEGVRKIEQWGLRPYQLSHVGNEYLSNVDVAMKSGYYYAQDMVKLSEDKNSGFYKYAERYAKKHDIPLDKLLWTEEDIIAEAVEAGSLSQWLYFTTGMPQVFRGYLKRAAFTLQSWSMNYLTKHLKESSTRTFTNRTSRGKLMRPIDRLNWLKGTAIIMGILWGLREAFNFSYERYLLPWGIVLNTNVLSPVGQILGGAFNYVTARNDWERTKALKQVKSAWKVFVPGSLAWKDAKAFLNGEISLKEYLFYIEWKEKGKKIPPPLKITIPESKKLKFIEPEIKIESKKLKFTF